MDFTEHGVSAIDGVSICPTSNIENPSGEFQGYLRQSQHRQYAAFGV